VPLADLVTLENILAWSLIVGLLGVAGMGGDKALAVFGADSRVSENTQWPIALVGGF